MSEHDQYFTKAKTLVAEVANVNNVQAGGAPDLVPDDFYVVWFAKTLGNWKALVSTDKVSGHYYEVTYDGNKQQTYVDEYIKTENRCFPDESYDYLQGQYAKVS